MLSQRPAKFYLLLATLYLIILLVNYSQLFSNCSSIKNSSSSRNEASSSPSEWAGFCGNFKYDNLLPKRKVGSKASDRILTSRTYYDQIPVSFRKQNTSRTILTRSGNIYQRLIEDLVHVRLNIVYDETMAAEYKDSKELENFVRNLIYSTQLIYEQPEMSNYVKINFVVVRLKPSRTKLTPDMDSNHVLESFLANQDDFEFDAVADINIFLTSRNLWDFVDNKQRKILGLANVGLFCRKVRGGLILNASSLGASITLAHELAHVFNCYHDGQVMGDNVERLCESGNDIMSPSNGPLKNRWSKCTVSCIADFFTQHPEVKDCIFSQTRIKSAKPINQSFNFTKSPDNPNRKPYPGEFSPIDVQCAKSLDQTASSALIRLGDNGGYSTCQNLMCILGGYALVSIGPAPTGSACTLRGAKKLGKCFNTECLAELP